MTPLGALAGQFPALLAALILATDRKILRRLREAGATDPARAIAFAPPGPVGEARLRRMVSGGAVGQAAGGYYLDEAGYLRWRAARRKRGLTMVGIMFVIVIGLIVAGAIRLR